MEDTERIHEQPVRASKSSKNTTLAESVTHEMSLHASQMEEIVLLIGTITDQLVYLGNRATGATFINEVNTSGDEDAKKMPDNLVGIVRSYANMVGTSRDFIGTSLKDISNHLHDISSTLVGVEVERVRGT